MKCSGQEYPCLKRAPAKSAIKAEADSLYKSPLSHVHSSCLLVEHYESHLAVSQAKLIMTSHVKELIIMLQDQSCVVYIVVPVCHG